METLFKNFYKVKFYIIIFISALFFIYFGFFENIPLSQNNYSFNLRPQINLLLLILGLIILITSILVFAKLELKKTKNNEEETDDMNFKIEEYSSVFSTVFTERENNIKNEFLELSDTQKSIVKLIYRLHRIEMTLDFLYEKYCSKYGNEKISNISELHYRVKDLCHKGFLEEKVVGDRATIILSIKEVASVLNYLKVLKT